MLAEGQSAVGGVGSLVIVMLLLCILQMKAIPLCFDGLLWPCCDPVVATFPQAVCPHSRKLLWLQPSTVPGSSCDMPKHAAGTSTLPLIYVITIISLTWWNSLRLKWISLALIASFSRKTPTQYQHRPIRVEGKIDMKPDRRIYHKISIYFHKCFQKPTWNWMNLLDPRERL